MSRIAITEEDNVQELWMKEAKGMTLDGLSEFLRKLAEDYEHDYGTICHAIAAAAVAAAWSVERTPQGGITGSQAGAVAWEMLRGWNSSMLGEVGTRILKMDDLLYPQYADRFTTIDADTFARLSEKAKENLSGDLEHTSPDVLSHWQEIANGKPPFGLRITHP